MGRRRREDSPELQSIDAHVGQRIRLRRTLLGMSQTQLGQAINLTFQQIQKYERGTNRVSAGMLFRISQVLDVPVSFFFDCYEGEGSECAPAFTPVDPSVSQPDISRREGRLLRYWRQAPPEVAEQIFDLLGTLSRATLKGDDEEDATGENGEGKDGAGRNGRRRKPGAVWDPADIR